MTRAAFRLVPFLAILLVACGGGGSGRDGGIEPPQNDTIRFETHATTLGVNSITDIVVKLTRHGGSAAADGTAVQLSVNSASLGQVGAASGENQSFGNVATATTAGGLARFRFKSTQQTGSVTLTASAASSTGASSITTSSSINLNGGASNDTRLTLTTDRTTIPVNSNNTPPSCRNYPYQAEVTVTWRNLRGELVTVPEDEDAMRAAWSSADSVGAITTPDNPETDENECEMFMASMGVPVNAGRGTVFVRSMSQAGTGTLTVSVRDLDTGEDLNASMDFEITSGAPSAPANVLVVPASGATYVAGSGGPTSRQLGIHVDDGAETPVPNPDGANNVRLEIVSPETGERLSATNAAGQTDEGTTVATRTFNGIAGAVFLAGERQGTVTIRATADRADNNVDNGIQDPIVGEGTVVVSDGQLFSLHLVSPTEDALFVNPGSLTPEDGGDPIPLPPDGTYSLTVSAIATDRYGNPVLPGKAIQFGLIDSPADGFPAFGGGNFDLFGLDGDPEEGGNLFVAPNGQFLTAGGGVQVGDALVLFGRDVTGGSDMESARIVDSVSSRSRLSVTRRFNLNDGTGHIVDLEDTIPYAIGRAEHGNINAQATTNAMGVATTEMNYPVNMLGRTVILWAQSDGVVVAGENKTVADVEFRAFAGLAPSVVTASPGQVPGNRTAFVNVCQVDALGAPMQGSAINFAFQNIGAGTGSIDGQAGAGVVGPTGANGCALAEVSTNGLLAGSSEEAAVRFFDSHSEAIVQIVTGDQILLASPSGFYGTGGAVTLTFLSANGDPVSGVQLNGRCTGSGDAVLSLSGPGTTNANGETTATISASNLNQYGSAGSGECVFEAPGGEPSVTVQLQGIDYCQSSPDSPACGDNNEENPNDGGVDLTIVRGSADATATASVTGPGVTACALSANIGAAQCNVRGRPHGTLLLSVALGGTTPASTVNWSGDCTPVSANQATVQLSGGGTIQGCTATLVP